MGRGGDRVVGWLFLGDQPCEGIRLVPGPGRTETSGFRQTVRYWSRRNEGTSSASSGTSNPPPGSGAAGTGASTTEPPRRRRRPPPKPVAITVTRTWSPAASSITAPKITFAFWSAALVTTSAASFTSKRPISGPPVMLGRIPVAPSVVLSTNGDDTAARAASAPRLSPLASPTPLTPDPPPPPVP